MRISMASTAKLAPVVAVLNLKGGVGKTTISAHVMRVLYHEHSKKTLLIDLDPQFNLTQAVIPRIKYDMLKMNEKTVFSAMEPAPPKSLFEVDTSSAAPPPPDALIYTLRRFSSPSGVTLDLLAGDFKLVKYSMVRDVEKLELVQKRFLRFVSQARGTYDLVCIDCNPSSSFITSCALHACSHLLVPVRPDRYSVLGLELLVELLDEIPSIHPKPQISVLLNGVQGSDHDRNIENELRAHPQHGTKVLVSKLRFSKLLLATSSYTGFATDRKVPHKNRLRSEMKTLANEIARTIGL
jgi:chromosome partitioning protein